MFGNPGSFGPYAAPGLVSGGLGTAATFASDLGLGLLGWLLGAIVVAGMALVVVLALRERRREAQASWAVAVTGSITRVPTVSAGDVEQYCAAAALSGSNAVG